jgi:endonuclease III
MKDGTRYADRLKKAYAKIKHSISEADIPEPRDSIRCLALGILGSDNGPDRAERQLNKALGMVVDWNEIRVSNVNEVAALLGDASADSLRRCQNLLDALHAIYGRENMVSLERLKSLGRREARQYLETLKGVDEYAVAYVVLWSFGGHAIPVWNHVLAALREADLVHPMATRAEIQAFLERNVPAADAKAFSLAIASLASAKAQGSTKTQAGAKAQARKKSSPTKGRKREAAKKS